MISLKPLVKVWDSTKCALQVHDYYPNGNQWVRQVSFLGKVSFELQYKHTCKRCRTEKYTRIGAK